MEQGTKQFQNNQTEAAIKTFTECIALKPLLQNANNCYFGRAMSYFISKDYEKAIPDFTEAWKSVLDNQSRYLRGRSYFELKNYDEAFKDFDYVIKLAKTEEINKQYPEVYAFRGAVFTAREKFDEAIADYTKTIELSPQFADAYFARGLVFDLTDEFEKAEKDLKKTLELDPKFKTRIDEVLKRIEEKKSWKEKGVEQESDKIGKTSTSTKTAKE